MPRGTDPVSRLGLGYLKAGFAEKSLILIPLENDSARKLAYILKSQGLLVTTCPISPALFGRFGPGALSALGGRGPV